MKYIFHTQKRDSFFELTTFDYQVKNILWKKPAQAVFGRKISSWPS
jgi:hypothetical protein